MKINTLFAEYGNKIYRIHKIFGLLLEFDKSKSKNIILSNKPEKLLQYVKNPYLLVSNIEETKIATEFKYCFIGKLLAKVYTSLCLRSFFFFRLLSYCRFPIFNSTQDAILFYQNLFPYEQQNLCLPRSLFAACTAKSFKDEGAIFIGVFLPSRAMHAWIIEKHCQPDPYDDIWICYQPVAIMYNN